MYAEKYDVNTVFGFWPKRNADIALETLVRLMAEHNISRACTLSARGIFLDFIAGNEETLAACHRYPQLVPVATVNPCRWIGCLDEAQHMINLGVKLFRFFPQYQEWHIGQAPFRKLLREVLAPAGVALMLPADMGFTALGDMAASIRNPVIVESFKYAFLAEAVVAMQEAPNVYIETHRINSTNWVEFLKSEGLSERALFGSNAPLSYISSAVAQVECADAPQADKDRIFGGNLRRVLGI